MLAAGQSQLPVTGIFGGGTYSAVVAFQQQAGLPVDGMLGALTWQKLLG